MESTLAFHESIRLIVAALDDTHDALRQLKVRLGSDPHSQPPEGSRKHILQNMRRKIAKLFQTKEDTSYESHVYPLFFIVVLEELYAELATLLTDIAQPLDAPPQEFFLSLALEAINNSK